jgi:hypothetical protein
MATAVLLEGLQTFTPGRSAVEPAARLIAKRDLTLYFPRREKGWARIQKESAREKFLIARCFTGAEPRAMGQRVEGP